MQQFFCAYNIMNVSEKRDSESLHLENIAYPPTLWRQGFQSNFECGCSDHTINDFTFKRGWHITRDDW